MPRSTIKKMNTKTINLRTIRTLANKYNLTWHVQGGGWVINGNQQHYSYKSEKAALIGFMLNWGQAAMTSNDYDTIRTAQAQLQSR